MSSKNNVMSNLQILNVIRRFNSNKSFLENYLICYFEKRPYFRPTIKNNLTTLKQPK